MVSSQAQLSSSQGSNFMSLLNSSPNNLSQILSTQQLQTPQLEQLQSLGGSNVPRCGNYVTNLSPHTLLNLDSTPLSSTPTNRVQAAVPLGPPSYNQIILDKLEMMNKRLCKLDSIESQVKSINERVVTIDTRLTLLETSVREQGRRLNDIEASRNYDSQVCHDLETKQINIDRCLQAEKKLREAMQTDLQKLKLENSRLSDEVVDLQSRSMRDNLLFFGLIEKELHEDRKNENCTELIKTLFKDTLLLENYAEIKIDRAHRIGKYSHDKTRPVVVKFNYYQDKIAVKNAALDKFPNTTYRVSDQFPRVIQEKRRQLVPELKKAREEGKDAVLVYDKLVIKGPRRRPFTQPRETIQMDASSGASAVASHV